MNCITCGQSMDQIKAKYQTKYEWFWTSPFTHQIVCSDCLIEEYQQNGKELPNNSLQALNEARGKYERDRN